MDELTSTTTTSSKSQRLKIRTIVIAVTIGIALVIFGGLIFPLSFQAIMDAVLDEMMVIDPKSPLYAEWQDPSLPIYTRFYFFDLQNPDEVLNGSKPEVIQIGPYSYKLSLPRENVTFNPNDTVTSSQLYTYVFDRSQSVGSENDTFMTTNMPFWGAVYMVRDSSDAIRAGLALFMKSAGETPFMPLTVKQLVWGYDEPFFEWITNNFPDFPLPEGFETQFGFLLGRNNTALGEFTVFTGVQNKSRINNINTFNGMSELNFWKSDYANKIEGTDGNMYHMGIEEDETLFLFHPDLCRSMPYIYEKDDVLEGVPLKMFGIAPWTYQNSSTYPDNKGFEVNDRDSVPTGLMRVDPCRYGSPVALSNPHFFNGDPCLQQVDGLEPNADKHRNYFSIEPDVTANEEVIGYYDTGIKLTGIISTLLQYMCVCIGASIIVPFVTIGLCKVTIRRKKSNSHKLGSVDMVDTTSQHNTAHSINDSDIEDKK